jgi:transmembrane 9 superfamily protein 3
MAKIITMRLPLVVVALAAAAVLPFGQAGTYDHRYKKGEHVELWVNKVIWGTIIYSRTTRTGHCTVANPLVYPPCFLSWSFQVGPYANPQEAYEYYKLPYCAPDTKHHPDTDGGRFNEWKVHSMGEHLGGHALRHSGHDITFLQTNAPAEKCTTKSLTKDEADHFTKAIQHRWFYQLYLDDLPVWGMVGEMLPKIDSFSVKEKDDLDRLDHMNELSDEEVGNLHPYVYTNRNLIISYNGDQIVKVDLTSDPKSLKLVKEGVSLEFSLQVQFVETSDAFRSRFDRYLDHDFFKHPIHWFSVFNSFMMVLFLMGLVALIMLRTLKKDYARYGLVGDLEDRDIDDEKEALHHEKVEESGWKQVHGDVFRAPHLLPLFAALVGTGWQTVVLTLGVILFAVLGPLHGEVHEERGEVMQSIIVCYAFSSIVSGFTSGSYFKEYYPTVSRRTTSGGASNLWQVSMGLTVIVLPVATVVIYSALNMISLIYGTINSIPFSVIFKIFLLWVFVSIPLCVVGTLLGRHANKGTASAFPCRVNAIPRPIPEDVPWYGKPSGLIPLAGLLSFGSIFIELYYVLTSLWNYKFYHVYGFLLGVYGILTIVVGMTSIIVVYFCLNAENYLWQWTAFASGASTAGYVFLYGIYYFVFKTQMHGLLQTCFYFGYMALISVNLGLLCGTLGHFAASKFVRAIFQNVKVD